MHLVTHYYPNYISHHGILGQKWGIRRYQNKDGTYTAEGKERRLLSSKERIKLYRDINKGYKKASKNKVLREILDNVGEKRKKTFEYFDNMVRTGREYGLAYQKRQNELLQRKDMQEYVLSEMDRINLQQSKANGLDLSKINHVTMEDYNDWFLIKDPKKNALSYSDMAFKTENDPLKDIILKDKKIKSLQEKCKKAEEENYKAFREYQDEEHKLINEIIDQYTDTSVVALEYTQYKNPIKVNEKLVDALESNYSSDASKVYFKTQVQDQVSKMVRNEYGTAYDKYRNIWKES